MARTLQLGDGGEDARDQEHTVFKKLATELPESWSVVWGKQFFQKYSTDGAVKAVKNKAGRKKIAITMRS